VLPPSISCVGKGKEALNFFLFYFISFFYKDGKRAGRRGRNFPLSSFHFPYRRENRKKREKKYSNFSSLLLPPLSYKKEKRGKDCAFSSVSVFISYIRKRERSKKRGEKGKIEF